MSRVVQFNELGGPEVLKLTERKVGEPGAGEVRLRVEAIGVNRADQMLRTGNYAHLPSFPDSQLGAEAVGVVEAVGAGVDGFAAGDQVLVTALPRMDLNGAYAEEMIVPADGLIHRPGGGSDPVEAAALWVVYATAYGALVEKAGLRAGDTVLITAASSGLGLAAIQVANHFGAVPIAVTRTERKKQALLDAGAKHVIVSEQENLAEAVYALTGGRGADLALDTVAGPGLGDVINAVKAGGTLVLSGWLDTRPAILTTKRPVTVVVYFSLEHTTDPEARLRIAAFLDAGLRAGTLKPTVDRVFPLDDVVEAHRYLEQNNQFGKIVLTVG